MTSGLVRHPIYAGVLVAGLATAVALSWMWLIAGMADQPNPARWLRDKTTGPKMAGSGSGRGRRPATVGGEDGIRTKRSGKGT